MKEIQNFSKFTFFDNYLDFYLNFSQVQLIKFSDASILTFSDLKFKLRLLAIVTSDNRAIKLKCTCLYVSEQRKNK